MCLNLKAQLIVSMMLNIYRPLCFSICITFTEDLALLRSFLTTLLTFEVKVKNSKSEAKKLLMCCKIISHIPDNQRGSIKGYNQFETER